MTIVELCYNELCYKNIKIYSPRCDNFMILFWDISCHISGKSLIPCIINLSTENEEEKSYILYLCINYSENHDILSFDSRKIAIHKNREIQ